MEKEGSDKTVADRDYGFGRIDQSIIMIALPSDRSHRIHGGNRCFQTSKPEDAMKQLLNDYFIVEEHVIAPLNEQIMEQLKECQFSSKSQILPHKLI